MTFSRIAKKAGVSIATVSRVVNNSRPVKPQIAELVRKAMDELQVSANHVRRRPFNGFATIAIVSLGQSYRGWFQMPVIAGVVAELSRAALDRQVGVFMAEMPDPNIINPVLRRPEVGGAIVFISSRISPAEVSTLRRHLPVVAVMGGQRAAAEIDHVGIDNNAVGRCAAEYLIKHELSELAFVTTEPSWDFIQLRAQGFLAAARERGLTPTLCFKAGEAEPQMLFGPKMLAAPSLRQVIERLVRQRSERIGLFVSRDEETVQAHALLKNAGVKVGQDVVIVSCDNEFVRLSTLQPRPVSIDLCPSEVARQAINRLLVRMKHPDESRVSVLVNPQLVEPDVEQADRVPVLS